MNKIEQLQQMIQNSNHIVFFGGAGVSTESGIPDFRSIDGLYNQKYKYPPEQILSHRFFMYHTPEFYEYYREKLIAGTYEPNTAHYKLAEIEHSGKLSAIITQNIDGLHQKAGSHHIIELHGSVLSNHCMSCHTFYGLEKIKETKGVPHCTCGGIIKPDVTLYEETLDEQVIHKAIRAIRHADALIIGGTSMNVYPAAGLVHYFSGNHLIIINRESTALDGHADLVIHDSIAQTLGAIDVELQDVSSH